MTRILFLCALFLCSCKTTTYYVVRHSERETQTMSGDVPLSDAGKQRAESLKDLLLDKNIRFIFSTNTNRTRSTAQPLATAKDIPISIYDPRDTRFMDSLRAMDSGNVLIIGHSNTVDDMVNHLTGKQQVEGDLPDSQYGDLFIIKRKGKKYGFQKGHFGK